MPSERLQGRLGEWDGIWQGCRSRRGCCWDPFYLRTVTLVGASAPPHWAASTPSGPCSPVTLAPAGWCYRRCDFQVQSDRGLFWGLPKTCCPRPPHQPGQAASSILGTCRSPWLLLALPPRVWVPMANSRGWCDPRSRQTTVRFQGLAFSSPR